MTLDRTSRRQQQAHGGRSRTNAMRVLPELLVKCFELRFLNNGGWQTVESWHPLPPGHRPQTEGSGTSQGGSESNTGKSWHQTARWGM